MFCCYQRLTEQRLIAHENSDMCYSYRERIIAYFKLNEVQIYDANVYCQIRLTWDELQDMICLFNTLFDDTLVCISRKNMYYIQKKTCFSTIFNLNVHLI